jgi:hypothetical protein
VLLRFILSPNVCPLSVDALKSTSSFPVLLVYHATETFLPVIATGASLIANGFAYVDRWSIIGVTPIVVPRVIIRITPRMSFLSFMRLFCSLLRDLTTCTTGTSAMTNVYLSHNLIRPLVGAYTLACTV